MKIITKPRCAAPQDIYYGAAHTDEIGDVFAAWQANTLLYLGLCTELEGHSKLRKFFPNAYLQEDHIGVYGAIADSFKAWRTGSDDIQIALYGTPFQLQVWNALLQVPEGQTVSYEDIAIAIKNPKAVRAVGTAIGQNPISILVPCHRVVPKSGGVGNYLWGSEAKENLLNLERKTA